MTELQNTPINLQENKIKLVPYELGKEYRTQEGETVRFVVIHNEGTSYETMEDENGVNRYTQRDFGRVTGTAHDYSDPRNTPPLFTLENNENIESNFKEGRKIFIST